MKTIIRTIIILGLSGSLYSCMDLDIMPVNLVTDDILFSDKSGIDAYMAEMYYKAPVEDWNYTHTNGWNNNRVIAAVCGLTGDAVSRDANWAAVPHFFQEGYELIRTVNIFIDNLENKYAGFHGEDDVRHWLGEAYMIRAFTYTAMAKRYGGIPIVTEALNDPELAAMPRDSELAVWEQIEKDYDYAIEKMRPTSEEGRFNKYAALAYKAQAMLFAASIANFSDIDYFDEKNGGTQVCGIPKDQAVKYYKSAYEAAKRVETGGYKLYKDDWKENDPEAQYTNYFNIHHKIPNSETVFVKYFRYPQYGQSWDCIYSPLSQAITGLSGGLHPSWDFVKLFDGIPDFLDENNKYVLFDTPAEPYKNAEPRLKANVILPFDVFKGDTIKIYKGIYVGEYPAEGLTKLYDENDRSSLYQNNNKFVCGQSDTDNSLYTLPDGSQMKASGGDGAFIGQNRGTRTGFLFRKLLDPSIPKSEAVQNRSDLDWIDMRYSEVLLTRAEAAFELTQLGANDFDYTGDAYRIIQDIRERAGAVLMNSQSELDRDVIRKERRKELSFEHKAWWDLIRWRTFMQLWPDSPRNKIKGANPFYLPMQKKWFFDVKCAEIAVAERVFPIRWYYRDIPADQINRNPALIQNPSY